MNTEKQTTILEEIRNMEPGATATFPIERMNYVNSLCYQKCKTWGGKYTARTEGDLIHVTRIK